MSPSHLEKLYITWDLPLVRKNAKEYTEIYVFMGNTIPQLLTLYYRSSFDVEHRKHTQRFVSFGHEKTRLYCGMK